MAGVGVRSGDLTAGEPREYRVNVREDRPTCPRCGYDLSGQVAAWTDACPLLGTCPECGLALDWRTVLTCQSSTERAYFETSQGNLPRALVMTTFRTLLPWRFWSWLQLHFQASPDRLVVAALFATGLMHLASIVVVCGASWIVQTPRAVSWMWGLEFTMPEWTLPASMILFPYYLPWERGIDKDAWIFIGLLGGALMPVAFVLLPQTLQGISIRRIHLCRIAVWWLACAPAVLAFAYFAREILDGMALGRWLACSVLFWNMVWWGFACSRYLKLPRAWLVSAGLLLITSLVAALIALLDPDLRGTLFFSNARYF
jgi:hypothetical protein